MKKIESADSVGRRKKKKKRRKKEEKKKKKEEKKKKKRRNRKRIRLNSFINVFLCIFSCDGPFSRETSSTAHLLCLFDMRNASSCFLCAQQKYFSFHITSWMSFLKKNCISIHLYKLYIITCYVYISRNVYLFLIKYKHTYTYTHIYFIYNYI